MAQTQKQDSLAIVREAHKWEKRKANSISKQLTGFLIGVEEVLSIQSKNRGG